MNRVVPVAASRLMQRRGPGAGWLISRSTLAPFLGRVGAMRVSHILVLFLLLASTGCVARQTVVASSELSGPTVFSGVWVREELYFGRGMSDGGIVSDEDFANFVDREVAPRLPNGFTLYDATGHYTGASGVAIREPTRVLIVLYREEDNVNRALVTDLIARYKQRFRQESVLRVTQKVRAEF